MKLNTKPELLAPAGSPEALEAAVAAGADAVYLGTPDFNARIGARNFTREALAGGMALCRAHGVKVHVTMNTLVWDREMPRFLAAAYEVLSLGADALIVADYGAAHLLKMHFPQAVLHASTQLSVHNLDGAHKMAEEGFSRVVLARELNRENLQTICENAPVETEMFIHGALCVSHSGQCLASALIGGRSGNRGLCAQPCRLPARDGSYPLSLKDSCLAGHIREIGSLGVASLKIEGRMKPASYVSGVVGVYRRLLDEGRNATPEEMEQLAAIFSRSGFTDSYFRGRILPDRDHRNMCGIRTEADKQRTKALGSEACAGKKEELTVDVGDAAKKLPVSLSARLRAGEPARLTMTAPGGSVTVCGETPETAINAPLSEADVCRCLSRLGETPFCAGETTVDLQPGVILRVSALNALRRAAVQAMMALPGGGFPADDPCGGEPIAEGELRTNREPITERDKRCLPSGEAPQPGDFPLSAYALLSADAGGRSDLQKLKAEMQAEKTVENTECITNQKHKNGIVSARFQSPDQLAGVGNAASCFDLIYLPLRHFAGGLGATGCVLPPVIFDDEWETVRRQLAEAYRRGARHALVTNAGQLAEVRAAGLIPHGDFRLNAANSFSAVCWQRELSEVILSPELTAPMARDIPGTKSIVVYGYLPMMLLEKCVIRDIVGCEKCGKAPVFLKDRIGKAFPLLRESDHRNLLLNGVPLWMADKPEVLRQIGGGQHFLFTVETPDEVRRVIGAYRRQEPPKGAVRRIQT